MKKESLNLGQKLLYLGIDRLKFEKKAVVTFKATSHFSKYKVSMRIKNSKTGTKTACVLGSNLKKLFSYLKSAPWNLSNCRVPCKHKNPQF